MDKPRLSPNMNKTMKCVSFFLDVKGLFCMISALEQLQQIVPAVVILHIKAFIF